MDIWMYVVGGIVLAVIAWLCYAVGPDLMRYIRISRM